MNSKNQSTWCPPRNAMFIHMTSRHIFFSLFWDILFTASVRVKRVCWKQKVSCTFRPKNYKKLFVWLLYIHMFLKCTYLHKFSFRFNYYLCMSCSGVLCFNCWNNHGKYLNDQEKGGKFKLHKRCNLSQCLDGLRHSCLICKYKRAYWMNQVYINIDVFCAHLCWSM